MRGNEWGWKWIKWWSTAKCQMYEVAYNNFCLIHCWTFFMYIANIENKWPNIIVSHSTYKSFNFISVTPFCSTKKVRGIYVGRQETVNVICNVTANPTPTHFRYIKCTRSMFLQNNVCLSFIQRYYNEMPFNHYFHSLYVLCL